MQWQHYIFWPSVLCPLHTNYQSVLCAANTDPFSEHGTRPIQHKTNPAHDWTSTQPIHYMTDLAHYRSGTWPIRQPTNLAHDWSGTQLILHITDPAHNQFGTWSIRQPTCTRLIWWLTDPAQEQSGAPLIRHTSGLQPIWRTTNCAQNRSIASDTQTIWHTTNLLLFSFVFLKILRSNCLRSMYWNYTILATLSSTTY